MPPIRLSKRQIQALNVRLNKKSAFACPDCGATMLYKKSSLSGEFFLGCGRFPDCRHTVNLPENVLVELSGDARNQRLPGF